MRDPVDRLWSALRDRHRAAPHTSHPVERFEDALLGNRRSSSGPPTRGRSRRSTRSVARSGSCSCSSSRTSSAWPTRPCSGASATSWASTTSKATAPTRRNEGEPAALPADLRRRAASHRVRCRPIGSCWIASDVSPIAGTSACPRSRPVRSELSPPGGASSSASTSDPVAPQSGTAGGHVRPPLMRRSGNRAAVLATGTRTPCRTLGGSGSLLRGRGGAEVRHGLAQLDAEATAARPPAHASRRCTSSTACCPGTCVATGCRGSSGASPSSRPSSPPARRTGRPPACPDRCRPRSSIGRTTSRSCRPAAARPRSAATSSTSPTGRAPAKSEVEWFGEITPAYALLPGRGVPGDPVGLRRCLLHLPDARSGGPALVGAEDAAPGRSPPGPDRDLRGRAPHRVDRAPERLRGDAVGPRPGGATGAAARGVLRGSLQPDRLGARSDGRVPRHRAHRGRPFDRTGTRAGRASCPRSWRSGPCETFLPTYRSVLDRFGRVPDRWQERLVEVG